MVTPQPIDNDSDIDERNLAHPINWVHEQRARRAIEAMKKRNFNAQYVATRKEALEAALALIPEGETVFRADSVTLDQIEVIPALRERGKNKIMWPQEKDGKGRSLYGTYEANHELYAQMQREVFSADIYMTGANAVTENGIIVSTDGAGNRVAPMLFGPRRVIFVVSANKIVKDLDAAHDRIRNFCAPVNVKRHLDLHKRGHYAELPCASTGVCSDCDHPLRICNYTGIVEGSLPRYKDRINMIFVGEELGM